MVSKPIAPPNPDPRRMYKDDQAEMVYNVDAPDRLRLGWSYEPPKGEHKELPVDPSFGAVEPVSVEPSEVKVPVKVRTTKET